MKALLRLALIAVIAVLWHPVSAAPSLPEYSAAEAKKHIGETATVVGKVDCIEHGRTHTDLEMGACLPNTLLMVVVPDSLEGLRFEPGQLRGTTIAVTGRIEDSGGMPRITIKSAAQIVPRTPVEQDYLESAMEKQSRGDLDGAIADLDRAVEQAHEPSMYIQRAEAKEKKGDLNGAISDYDELIQRHPSEGVFYLKRAWLKTKKSDYDGVIADCGSAIRLLPKQRATMQIAQAYSTRAEAEEAKGNFGASVADYQMAINADPIAPIYKNKLKHAQAAAARGRMPLADNRTVYADDRATANLNRSAQTADDAESPTALVTRAKLRIRTGDFDGAIADCDRALQLSRGGSKEASGLRIQAMRAKGSSKSAVAQPVNPGRPQEEQPIAPSTESGPPVAAGQARPKATSALLVDPTSGQPIGRETYNGSVKVEYSDGRSETFCKDGNCTHPHVSHEGHVGWTHYTHRGNRNAAMNERLVIRFSNGQTKEFKPNPNGGPFIEEWNFIDNDVAVAIKSRGYHGAASFVRYDLISGRMTGHQDGYVEYEKMPEWAQPFSDDIPFPAASKADASEQTLSKQKALKSVNGNVKTQITFVNRSKQGVKVYWLDYSGERVLYRKLKDSESYTQDTYMTHPWLITDLRDNLWQIYMPTLQPRTVIVTAPKKP
jgi:tetratricopeptide (TPR) repeat protein